MKKESTLTMLDVKNEKLAVKNRLSGSLSGVMITEMTPQKSPREEALERYVQFFKKNLAKVDDIESPDYTALEIANDEGLNVTSVLKQNNAKLNFKICHIGLIETLIENPVELQKVNLIHAVLPFDNASALVTYLSDIPEISNATTRVALGLYGNSEDSNYDYSRRILSRMIRSLDFFDYKDDEIDGTTVKMVWSTYQKNMRMRH